MNAMPAMPKYTAELLSIAEHEARLNPMLCERNFDCPGQMTAGLRGIGLI
jgi:hypothetical protein